MLVSLMTMKELAVKLNYTASQFYGIPICTVNGAHLAAQNLGNAGTRGEQLRILHRLTISKNSHSGKPTPSTSLRSVNTGSITTVRRENAGQKRSQIQKYCRKHKLEIVFYRLIKIVDTHVASVAREIRR